MTMRAARLEVPGAIETGPVVLTDVPVAKPAENEILLRVKTCGVCHTDLHIAEGDLKLQRLPLIPGHQIIGVVKERGHGVTRFREGDRVGVPWLYAACGVCEFCRAGKENLCDDALFTGYHVDGGFAECAVVREESAYPIPEIFSDAEAAPLLCAGVIGYRALRLSEIRPGQRIGLYGFGASAHIAIQIARHWGCEIYVFTRGESHRELAKELGAAWTGSAEERAPHEIDSAVIFAPVGHLVHSALRALRKGGTIALAGIHMSPIPEMEYKLLYEERTLRSVANSTREDVRGLLKLAEQIPIRTKIQTFPLEKANSALQLLKHSGIQGCGVLLML
jgi:propanol-preferring alcohol dehydrogenase